MYSYDEDSDIEEAEDECLSWRSESESRSILDKVLSSLIMSIDALSDPKVGPEETVSTACIGNGNIKQHVMIPDVAART